MRLTLHQGFDSLTLRQPKFTNGPLVKRLRHRPFTAVTRVRIPYGSPTSFKQIIQHGGLAQLGEHLPYKQGVGGSSPSSSTINLNNIIAGWSSGSSSGS